MNERKCVKLDLYIDEEDSLRTNSDENADEVLCLRILSCKTAYRFGGLKVHIASPVFSVAKVFNVEFDEDSEVALIKGQSESARARDETHAGERGDSKAATIVISPDREDVDLLSSATVRAELTLLESVECDKVSISSAHSVRASRRMSQQVRRLMSRPFQSSWHSAVRVKRFFSDSLTFWN